ncbi:hypothetical protein DL95DRAFT_407172 [Leptodontidium sp. 2 PMI_412]|nr:hypothetical protein DL95DRAFT_407172 [Leptodontidium sp. 2 PMI_412]
MSSFENRSRHPMFPAVDKLLKNLQTLQNARLQEDDEVANTIKAELDEIQNEGSRRTSELKIDQVIRRGEETVRIWKSIPFGSSQNGARAIRDAALSNLTKLESEERSSLEQELQRLVMKVEIRCTAYAKDIEQKRELEDEKQRQIVAQFTASKSSPQNLLGLIVVVQKLQATTQSFQRQMLSPSSLVSPNVSFSGMAAGPSTMISFGLPTPSNTPPSSSGPRFGSPQAPPTPTPAPRKSSANARSSSFTIRQPGRQVGVSLSLASIEQNPLQPFKPFTTGSTSASGKKAKKNAVVIDLTSDTEDELPIPKRRQTGTFYPIVHATLTPPPKLKIKRVAKKPIIRPAVHTYATPKKVETNIQTPVAALALAVDVITKKLENITEPVSIRASPGIFDSDSDYSDTQSRKRRRNNTLETTRIRSGKLLMGELLDAPGCNLSPAKGLLWKNWARRVFSPQKLIKFTVKFIWTYKENGEISKFNDDTNPLGFYFLRRAHTYVPVIGHVKKEAVYPEFVLEEGDMEHIQYNSEFALACVTKSTGIQSDVLIKFGSRAELWDFLVVTNMEMNIHVFENLDLKLPTTWLV